ncbi:maleylpyruvate isomerase N-terminal domain-containing protein [Umezawaea sp. Da 62-37]|uniref:maleylpyruvate isomerase N-terminal domain-containing protein n=1 Tax=Umezawaea sp. Da 62-37 TaxID=3075927 RepID=UPI0028F71E39|nr:maleylpyruvate isomerase N-terminal domain-containing protein [Umezawaea sp. Da 62-37]WNV91184.1 maleylpyruvate isomerase N-terminal domain-containing protein [Umezawaea sp. Da 62-37]
MPAGWTTQRWTEVFLDQSAMFREAVAEADPAANVPSCPGWTFADLAVHVARFLETSIEYLRTGSTVRLKPPPPPVGASPIEYLDTQLADAAEVLPLVPGNRPTWTFSPAAPDLAWVWHRRIAHELDLRRWDAQAALRQLVLGDADLAADGIDEALGTLLAAKYTTDVPLETAGTVIVRCTDVPEGWHVRLTPGEVPEVRAVAPGEVADVEVDGEAQLIHYGLWGRLPLKSVGDEAVLRAVRMDR